MSENGILDLDSASDEELDRLRADYLKLAREALNRAEALLLSAEEEYATYAALELRRALEALVYENALRFTDELTGEDYLIWQPSQLLEQLIEIDPAAAMDLELHMQNPKTREWVKIGRQERISLKALKKHYFALGSHLHTPSLAQIVAKRGNRLASLLKLCRQCADLIAKDLNASLRFGRMAMFGQADIECLGCGAKIRRRLNALRTSDHQSPSTRETIVANCSKCPASFEIRADPDEKDGILWQPQMWSANCPDRKCDGVHEKWLRELKDGMGSVCPKCGLKAVFTQTFGFFAESFLAELREKTR